MAFCPVCHSDYPDDWRKCPKDDVVLLDDRQVGKYTIHELIGSGGMGAVYRAENPDTRAQVAIKLLHPGASAQDSARERFRREAAAVAGLSTRHVITIHDFGADERGTLYLIMELLAGHSLREEIGAGPLELPRIGFVVDHALQGLAAAHRASITHRDLKPENIFVATTDDGEIAKVLDFGIARTDASESKALTGSGALMGTPAYMAPEQITGSRGDVGPWTDVYAMGVILYEMFAGSAPFAADSVSAVLGRILEREFRPLRQLYPKLPARVLDLVDRAMSPTTSERYANASELRDAWRHAWNDFGEDVTEAPVPAFVPATKVGPDRTPAGKKAKVDPHSDTDIASAATAAAATPGPASRPGYLTTGGRGELTSGDGRPRGPSWGIPLAIAGLLGIGALVYFLGPSHGPAATADAALVATVADAMAVPAPDAAVAAIDGMVFVPGGEFEMGTPERFARYPNALHRHRVTIAPFYIDRFELRAPSSDRPRTQLTYAEAEAACRAEGKRLLTEAEWELVASRAELDPGDACLRDDTTREPAAVGTHPGDCTKDGVCDLLGNVLEWVADPWRVADKAAEPGFGTVRGASFGVRYQPGSVHATVFARNRVAMDGADAEVGVRCGKSP